MRTGEILPSPTFEQRAEMALRQARLNIETTRRDVDDAVRILRQQIVNYLKGTKHAARLREMIVQAKSLQEIERLLEPLLR
jgi:tRNA-dihydrouridine synthase